VLGLADTLRAIFFESKAPKDARSQGDLSASGKAWEALVAWYLNLVLAGTPCVVLARKREIPRVVRDALTVSYGTNPTSTESDLVAIGLEDYEVSGLRRAVQPFAELSAVASDNVARLNVAVVQCKTNWNDTAQVPMLWDLVYRADGFSSGSKGAKQVDIRVGVQNRSPRHFRSFAYAFATVPTQKKLTSFSPSNTPVLRVRHLTGGNYWGLPSRAGVADSLKEFFARARIGPDDGRGVRQALERSIPLYPTTYRYLLNPYAD
jgi:hypothetical protein